MCVNVGGYGTLDLLDDSEMVRVECRLEDSAAVFSDPKSAPVSGVVVPFTTATAHRGVAERSHAGADVRGLSTRWPRKASAVPNQFVPHWLGTDPFLGPAAIPLAKPRGAASGRCPVRETTETMATALSTSWMVLAAVVCGARPHRCGHARLVLFVAVDKGYGDRSRTVVAHHVVVFPPRTDGVDE